MRRSVGALALGILLVASSAPAEIYRWVDDAGRVHLDDDLARVPESRREGMSVFKARSAPPPPQTSGDGPTQGTFAAGLVRELGLQTSSSAVRDPVSVLQVVGIYPSVGWHPAAELSSAAVHEVVSATRAAARAGRLGQPEAGAEAAALRAASALGVAGPPPSAPPPPPVAAPPPIVVAPNIVVEAAPPVVVVEHERTRDHVLGDHPTFVWGVPFAPLPQRRVTGPIPERITPLANPAGRLEGPLVTPLESRGFTRPFGF